jgi:hypothetical protein
MFLKGRRALRPVSIRKTNCNLQEPSRLNLHINTGTISNPSLFNRMLPGSKRKIQIRAFCQISTDKLKPMLVLLNVELTVRS